MLHRARIEFWWSSLSKTWCEELLRENISVEVFNKKLEKDTGCRKNNYKEGGRVQRSAWWNEQCSKVRADIVKAPLNRNNY